MRRYGRALRGKNQACHDPVGARATRPARPRRQVDRVLAGPTVFFDGSLVQSRAPRVFRSVAMAGVPSASFSSLRCDPVAPRSACPGCIPGTSSSDTPQRTQSGRCPRSATSSASPADALLSTAAPTTRSTVRYLIPLQRASRSIKACRAAPPASRSTEYPLHRSFPAPVCLHFSPEECRNYFRHCGYPGTTRS